VANLFQNRWMQGAIVTQPVSVAGQTFYVDSTNGSNAHSGRSWEHPLATLNYAISLCSDDSGDVIMLAPYHAETIEDTGTASGATTDEVVIDKCGITIIGLGSGQLRPTFTLATATDAAFVVTAGTTNIVIDNLIFTSDLADVAAAITLTATSDGATIKNCEFKDGGASLELVIGITIAANCDDVAILNCNFIGDSDDASAISLAGGCDRLQFIGNTCQGTFSVACIDATTAASTEVIIANNIIVNTGNLSVGLNASGTGIAAWNVIAGGSGTVATGFTGVDAMWLGENYVTDAVDASGIVSPAADGDGG